MEKVKNDHVLGHDGHDHLNLVINGESYEWKEEFITGSQIRELNGIPHESEIFLAIKRPWEDELITDESLRKRISEESIKLSQEKFNITSISKQLSELYLSLS